MEKTIGQIIREKRTEKGLTQEQLADKLGVTPQAVSKWENDISYPDITLLKALAGALDCTVGDLLGEEKKEERAVLKPAVDTCKLMLRIRISGGEERLSVNLPVALLTTLLESDHVLSFTGNAGSVLKQIDFKAIMQMVTLGTVGKLLEMDTDDGEKVEIYVE